MVDYFEGKYLGKEHALHLKAVLEDNYKVTTDWEGKLYIGIVLKWYYEKGTVQLSMPLYVRASFLLIQNKKNPQYSP